MKTDFTDAKIITPNKAQELIKKHGNKWFWAAFVRKNDKVAKDALGNKVTVARAGDIRYMCCRTGVKKHLKTPNGEGRAYNFTEKRLTSVWDRKANGYRAFSWDYLTLLKIGGEKYVVLNETSRSFCRRNPKHDIASAFVSNGIVV